MNLTLDQEEKLRFMIADISENLKELSNWERDFMNDQIKRYDEYGATMRLSPKQFAIIERIYEKITDVD